MGDRAVIGAGQPWATARDGEAEWLAPDWQGTLGGPRDPFGAALGPDAGALRLGFRGEVEFAGQAWLRARAYDPSTRGFLDRDPLAPVAGTAYAATPYHYAGNDPIGRADPLGRRPVTDQELREIRDRMGSNFVSRNKDWIIAGALIVGGIAVMATGVGGPLGAAMIGGALLSAGSSAAIQKVTTGEVNYTEVAIAGLVGGAAGGLGYGAGALVSGTSKAAAVGRGAMAGGVESVAGGAANRGIHGENPFDPAGMGRDLLLGGAIGGVGGRLGAREPEPPPHPIGFAPGEGVSALQNVPRLQHASRHLMDDGIIEGPWKGKTSPELVREKLAPILENPRGTYDDTLGQTRTKVFTGEVDGHNVAVHVYKEGKYQGEIGTAVQPQGHQLTKWGF